MGTSSIDMTLCPQPCMCGAEDCRRCRPENFIGGRFIGDIEEEIFQRRKDIAHEIVTRFSPEIVEDVIAKILTEADFDEDVEAGFLEGGNDQAQRPGANTK